MTDPAHGQTTGHRLRDAVCSVARVLAFALLCLPAWQGSARAADIQQIRSPGGISAWLVEEKSLPIIAIRFAFDGRYQASTISYRFEGRVADGAMQGSVLLGAASDQNSGIVNRSQFGAGEWQARRLG